ATLTSSHPAPLEAPAAHLADRQPSLRHPDRPRRLHARGDLPRRHRPHRSSAQPSSLTHDQARSTGELTRNSPPAAALTRAQPATQKFLTAGKGADAEEDHLSPDTWRSMTTRPLHPPLSSSQVGWCYARRWTLTVREASRC